MNTSHLPGILVHLSFFLVLFLLGRDITHFQFPEKYIKIAPLTCFFGFPAPHKQTKKIQSFPFERESTIPKHVPQDNHQSCQALS